MKQLEFREIDGGKPFYMMVGFLGLFILAALGAAWYMEHNGHWVTGMNNQIVWGTPHVFAVFLIVAASGALNVASISSVFNKAAYKPLARLSGLLAIALLVGGPDGLADECLDRADMRWSLSPLTLPHALVRVLLAEQLYRAWTVIQGHPYHRG